MKHIEPYEMENEMENIFQATLMNTRAFKVKILFQ